MSIRELYQIKVSGGTDLHENVLRKKAQKVNIINDEVLCIIDDLRDTLWAYPFCVGLSAPQIGQSLAISVVNIEKTSRENDMILINPHVIEARGKKSRKRESCMSVWGKTGEVERRDQIVVEYQDLDLNIHRASFDGFISRAIQHEIDHLDGILYSDKLVSGKELLKAEFFNDYTILK